MEDNDIIEILRSFPTGVYTDAFLRLGIRGWTHGLRPLNPDVRTRVVGRAITARFLPIRGRKGSPTKIYEVIRMANPGDVLVIQAPYPQEVIVGGLVAACATAAALAGVVLDGYLRDVEEIKETQLPIWYKGIGMERPSVIELHDWDIDIDCSGAQVRPGDYIIADQDGVIVLPPEELEEVIESLRHVHNIEGDIEELIARNGPLEEIYTLFKLKGQKTAQN